jgi:hypothetical protein
MAQPLDRNLLSAHAAAAPGIFHATTKAHGLYNTLHFVLRLSPRIHAQLAGLPQGVVSASDMTQEEAQAASTYLHETVHWWQHVGSTYGFALSLCVPCGLQSNYARLKELLTRDGLKKSIRSVAYHADQPSMPDTVAGIANIIINNQFDFEAFARLTHSVPTRAAILNDPMFRTVGHAFNITWSNVAGLIGSTFDPDWQVLTDPREWEEAFTFLASEEGRGKVERNLFQRSESVPIYPIGAYEIMEGQARFAQLQFLHFGSGGAQDWAAFEAAELLFGPYIAAFDLFLTMTGFERPASFDDPVVALFMLICDMALNPSAGFPMPLAYPHALVEDLDPGARFYLLSALVKQAPELATRIRTYSRQEYAEVSAALAEAAKFDAPLAIAETFASWPSRTAAAAAAMREYDDYRYAAKNMPVRVLFTHFIAFMQDKALRPEVFCWPGVWMTGDRISADLPALFDRHSAMFVDKPDDDGVFPRLRHDRNPGAIQTVFDEFYGAVVLYDLVGQWITEDGPFRYDLRWLVQHGTPEAFQTYASQLFIKAFGVDPAGAMMMPPWAQDYA